MRTWMLIGAVVALTGCAEVVQGPRVVHYNPNWFYIRHASVIDSRSGIDQIAAELCPVDRPAMLVSSEQYFYFDLRDAIYRCQSPTPAPTSTVASEPAPAAVPEPKTEPAAEPVTAPPTATNG